MSSVAPEKKHGVISSFSLKWIAVAALILYSTATIVLEPVLTELGTGAPSAVKAVYSILLILGQICLPISCFLAAEGCAKSHSSLRYGVVVLLFAFLSEIPFSYAYFGKLFDAQLQNPLFSISFAILPISIISITLESKLSSVKKALIIAVSVIIACGGSYLLNFYGSFYVVLAVLIMYFLRKNRLFRLLGIIPLCFVSTFVFPWPILAVIPICLYNEKRGKGSKYFFYYFYPAHLLVFILVSRILTNVLL